MGVETVFPITVKSADCPVHRDGQDNRHWHVSLICIQACIKNIVAAFRGMHVSPAKHSYT